MHYLSPVYLIGIVILLNLGLASCKQRGDNKSLSSVKDAQTSSDIPVIEYRFLGQKKVHYEDETDLFLNQYSITGCRFPAHTRIDRISDFKVEYSFTTYDDDLSEPNYYTEIHTVSEPLGKGNGEYYCQHPDLQKTIEVDYTYEADGNPKPWDPNDFRVVTSKTLHASYKYKFNDSEPPKIVLFQIRQAEETVGRTIFLPIHENE